MDLHTCQLGVHCGGEGRIQLHAVPANMLVCIKCAAGEEHITEQQVRPQLRSGEKHSYPPGPFHGP